MGKDAPLPIFASGNSSRAVPTRRQAGASIRVGKRPRKLE